MGQFDGGEFDPLDLQTQAVSENGVPENGEVHLSKNEKQSLARTIVEQLKSYHGEQKKS